MNIQTKKVPISQVRIDPNNPRSLNKEKFKKLKLSVKEFPEMLEVRPLVVAEGVVVGGNMRLLAMKDLGYREVSVIDVTEWTQEKRDQFMIKDNLSFGDWDYDLLANEWNIDDLTDWGMDLWDTEPEEMQGLTDEDEVPEAPEEPITKLGDVWILGEHRVMCGDSTSKEAVEILMDGEKADMVFTDPPYGVSVTGGRSETVKSLNIKKIENDELRGATLQEFIRKSLCVIPLKKDGSFYVCYDQKTQVEFISAIKENWSFRRTLVWNKNVFGLSGKKGYRPKYELIAFGSNGDDYVWYGDNSQADVIDVARPTERHGNHPTPKPVELILVALKNSSQDGDIVVDSFMGSGATLIAAEKTKRKCYGMELDPKYCDVIVKRWEDFTGKKATREIDDLEVMTQAH
jgi:DNA modification methylase